MSYSVTSVGNVGSPFRASSGKSTIPGTAGISSAQESFKQAIGVQSGGGGGMTDFERRQQRLNQEMYQRDMRDAALKQSRALTGKTQAETALIESQQRGGGWGGMAPGLKRDIRKSTSGVTGSPQYLNLGHTATGSKEAWTEYQGDAPEYQKFDYDPSGIDRYARRFARTGVRRAREGLTEALTGIDASQFHGNFAARAQMYRSALQGYSSGIGNVYEGAYKAGVGAYGQEYAAGASQEELAHQSAVRAYERTGRQKATQTATQENKWGSSREMFGAKGIKDLSPLKRREYEDDQRKYRANINRPRAFRRSVAVPNVQDYL